MNKKAIVGAAASLCLVGTAGTSALAVAHHPAAKGKLSVSLSNYKPKSGDTVKGTLHHAKKGIDYVCLQTTYKKGVALSVGDSYVGSASTGHKAHKGKVHCKVTFVKGPTPNGHNCPPTHKDKKHGWKCGFAIADPAA
ncbi:MAG: hypothetical protein JO214_08420, partial [Frankiaceae bacterium]|nr:hypothetical protein [Frankiaceae bacterium]